MASGWDNGWNSQNQQQSTNGGQFSQTENNMGSNQQVKKDSPQSFNFNGNGFGQEDKAKTGINWDYIVEDEFRKEIGKFAEEQQEKNKDKK